MKRGTHEAYCTAPHTQPRMLVNEVETMSYYGNTMEEFEAVNQHNETFSSDDMEGKVWLANMIFTECVTVCPPMTQNMTELTQELDSQGLEDIGIISFSVDPKRIARSAQ